MEPVSPIKTLAGFLFQKKKPTHAPARAAAAIEKPKKPFNAAITPSETAAVTVTELQSPSTPSVKFTALTLA